MKTNGASEPAVLAWIYILRIYTLVARCADQELKKKGVTLSRFDVIAQLGIREECCTQGDLCDELLVTKGHVSGLLDKMVKEGLMTRETDPSNRRCNRVQLTPRGRRIFQEMIPCRDSCVERMFSQLRRREQITLKDLLGKLLESVKSHRGGD